MKFKVLIVVFLLLSGSLFSQINNETSKEKEERMAWWTEARFGMFIHWGLYALPARHEWVMSKEQISRTDYEKYVDYFVPDLYNPNEWAKLAKAAT